MEWEQSEGGGKGRRGKTNVTIIFLKKRKNLKDEFTLCAGTSEKKKKVYKMTLSLSCLVTLYKRKERKKNWGGGVSR